MTTPLTPAEIPALRALADKATPGPWRQHLVDDTTVVDRFGEEIAQTFPEGGNNDDVDFATNTEQREDDAAFIAAARDALPRALDTIEAQAATIAERDAEIARLRAENDAMRDAIATANNTWRHEFSTEIEAASDKLFKRLSATSLCHPARAHVRAALAKEPQT